MIHGHTHPYEGFRWEDDERILALNTSKYTSPQQQAIASLCQGKLDVFPLVEKNARKPM